MFIPLTHQVQCPKCQRIGEIQLLDSEASDIHCQCKKCETSFYIPSPFNHKQTQDFENKKELGEALKEMLEKWEDRIPKHTRKEMEAYTHPLYEF